MARPLITSRIRVTRELCADKPRVRGRTSDLQQAIVQLLLNARDAMPEGGALVLRTEILEGKLAKIVVDDTGPGLDEAARTHLYEPFFSTRASETHKGMGLAIVKRIAEAHAGRITVENGASRGVTARLVLPLLLERARA
jgi:signal transduction histidine kinase